MTQQLLCDECGEPIDQTKPYYTLTGQKVQMGGAEGTSPGSLTAIDIPVSLEYHEEHLPRYKIQGQEVETPVVNPLQ
jgi:hypothetical protein